ncbi:sugar ABC transporter substrate-binding protein [Reticulibacter mediterranei]|uniref:sugar ABC transporter substrate-binding protein n=1 Tax=Reticulibacter mediterranei TaxID=2778369 RepID=UPI001C68BF46|nr:sugar ABC transporter substrate-binding protein [Reticulibacter mediterranei]
MLRSAGAAGAGLSLSSLLGAFGLSFQEQEHPICISPSSRRLKAAFTNNSLTHSWCAQGKQAAETWGRWFGVDISWYDGQDSINQQRKALDDIASTSWDFVAIQANGTDTLIEPVQRLLDHGIPVIQMDTAIDSSGSTDVTTFIEPDNVYMGQTSATALFEKMGGRGNVIMTQGQLDHTGAQGRTKGFYQAMEKYPGIELIAKNPANWDANKTMQLWEDYLARYKHIAGGFFHDDDMALAALKVIRKAGRQIFISGIDAVPASIEAVMNGSMVATIRNPAGRIHGGAVMVGILAANGMKAIPKHILADGPLVTQENGAGLIFLENLSLL